MRLRQYILALVAAQLGSAALADASCPAHRLGELYPWDNGQAMSRDQSGDLAIALDAHGRVTDCKAVSGQLQPETGFWICTAISGQAQFDPIMKDGVAVPGTRTEHFLLEGMVHKDANATARKSWFVAHPAARPNCYPDAGNLVLIP